MIKEYLDEFEKMNTTTESIYDLGDLKTLIILKDGTNLTDWDDVINKEEILFISEDLSDETDLSCRYANLTSLEAIVAYGVTDKVTNMNNLFYKCGSLNDISSLSSWDTSGVTSMEGMFYECRRLFNFSYLSNWAVSNVKTMRYMFSGSGLFMHPNEFEWDTSNVTNMEGMFSNIHSLVLISCLQSWDVSNVISMKKMFSGCNGLTDISPLNNWNVSNVKDMSYMFEKLYDMTNISLDKWDTSNVEDMSYMFYECNSLRDISSLSHWDVSNVTNIEYMFCDGNFLSDISALKNWDVSKINNMGALFYGCGLITDLLPLKNWDVSKVEEMSFMFYCCDSLLDISALADWDEYPKWYSSYAHKKLNSNLIDFLYRSPYRPNVFKSLENEVLTHDEIAERTNYNGRSVKNVLRDLIDNGLVELLNPEARKGQLYQLSEVGKEVLEQIKD